MRLARNAEDARRVADLGVRGALKELAAPQPEQGDEGESSDERDERIEARARQMVAEKHEGREVDPRLVEAEVAIQTVLLRRQEAAHAALELASMFATKRPSFAAACSALAAAYLHENPDVEEELEIAEAEERFQVESAALHAELEEEE